MSEAARSRRDGARHEPQVGIPGRDGAADPLAELARLVGQEDPFRRVFRPAPAPALAEHAPPQGWEADHPADEAYAPEHAYEGEHHPDHGHDPAAYAGYEHHDEHGAPHGYDDEDYRAAEEAYAAEYALHGDEAGIADAHLADEAAVAALPDMWARGDDGAPDRDAGPLAAPPQGRSSARRPLAVLAAVLVLTGGGLAASFLAKGPSAAGTAVVAAGKGAPTIMAATGPTKVKVEDTSATAPEDQDAALLNKNANLSSGPVKIVSSQEQPTDLSQLPKTADLAAGARPLPSAPPSPFPEPKKVKTFVVHPDGSMMSGDMAAAPAVDAAQPSTPAAAEARGGATTPRSAPPAASPASVAALAADPASTDATSAARQPASPGVHAAAQKPGDAAAPAGAAGSFGLQLASSPGEADAQAAFGRLKKKYPALLGSLTATIHKAETGDKPVYRVRVGGMSQEEAKSLCTKLQGAGGSCFVVHN